MRRRELIKYVGVSASVGMTGCIGGEGEEPGNTTDDTDDNGTDTDDMNRQPTLVNTDFSIADSRSGTGTENATVEFDTDENTVHVQGSIIGNNGCYRARLGDAEYDAEEDSLVVNVESFEDRAENEMCTEVLINIEYDVTSEFEGGLPAKAEVRHDGERVVEKEIGTPATEEGRIESTEFRVAGVRNAESEDVDDAKIEFEEDEGTVVVNGTIRGSDGCKTAVLDSAEYSASEDEISLAVVTRNREDADRRMCTQALVEIDYVARVKFDGEIPNNASVSHDGRRTFGASYASDSATAGSSGQE